MATTDEWREDVRAFWERQHADMQQLIGALGGGLMSALDDLKAAVAGNQEVSSRVADLVDSLQDQVTALQTQVQELIDAGNADLQPLVEQINAIAADLTAAEAPNTPEEPPVEPPMDM